MGDKGYTIIRSLEFRKPDENDEIRSYHRFYARSKKGRPFSVEVRDDQLEKAPDLLSAKASMLDGI